MPGRIVSLDVTDVRFPTSRELDGSDAMNPDPDYSAAYVVLGTDDPGADTVSLTRTVEAALAQATRSRPPGVDAPRVTFRQADFIEASIGNLQGKLAAAAGVVAVVVLLFLGNARTTLISLTAIPLSILVAILVFRALDVSINTMTLGGLAIAIGELVDDAVVDVENIFRRLRENRRPRGAARR